MSNPIEKEVKEKIKEHRKGNGKEITQSTVDTYATRIRILYDEIGGKKSLIDFLNQYNKVLRYLAKKYPKTTSMKSILFTILTTSDALGSSALAKYQKKFDDIKNKEKEEMLKKTEKMVLGGASKDFSRAEILEKVQDLKKDMTGKKGQELFDLYQQYLVLNLYTLVPPLRNNYVDVLVSKKPVVKMDEDKNYIFLNESKLILNKYKTKRTYGSKTLPLPKELIEIIKEWMKIRVKIHSKLKDRQELLLNPGNLEPMARRNFSKYLNKIFGKPVSVSMLRKAYVMEKNKDSLPADEMERDAFFMCHSISTQQKDYRKMS